MIIAVITIWSFLLQFCFAIQFVNNGMATQELSLRSPTIIYRLKGVAGQKLRPLAAGEGDRIVNSPIGWKEGDKVIEKQTGREGRIFGTPSREIKKGQLARVIIVKFRGGGVETPYSLEEAERLLTLAPMAASARTDKKSSDEFTALCRSAQQIIRKARQAVSKTGEGAEGELILARHRVGDIISDLERIYSLSRQWKSKSRMSADSRREYAATIIDVFLIFPDFGQDISGISDIDFLDKKIAELLDTEENGDETKQFLWDRLNKHKSPPKTKGTLNKLNAGMCVVIPPLMRLGELYELQRAAGNNKLNFSVIKSKGAPRPLIVINAGGEDTGVQSFSEWSFSAGHSHHFDTPIEKTISSRDRAHASVAASSDTSFFILAFTRGGKIELAWWSPEKHEFVFERNQNIIAEKLREFGLLTSAPPGAILESATLDDSRNEALEQSVLRPLAAGERITKTQNKYAPWLGVEGERYSLSTRNKFIEEFVHSSVGLKHEYEWKARFIDAEVGVLCKKYGTQLGIDLVKRFVAEVWKIRYHEGIYEVWNRTGIFLKAISDSAWLDEAIKREARKIYEELVTEAKAYVLANAESPFELIGKEFRRNKIVILGDSHGSFDFDMFVSRVVSSLKKWGVDNVAIERPAIYQDIVEKFLETGEVTREVEFVVRGERALGLWGPSYFEILEAARKGGIKVTCMDLRTSTIDDDTDGNDLMARMIQKKVLRKKGKALIYVGAYHAIKNRSGLTGPYLGEHLRKMTRGRTFSIKQISAETAPFEVMDDIVKGTRLEGESFALLTPGSKGSFDAVIYHGWLNYGLRATWPEWSQIFSQQTGRMIELPRYPISFDELLDRKAADSLLMSGQGAPIFTHGANTINVREFEARKIAESGLYAKPPSLLSRLGIVVRPLLELINRPKQEIQSAILRPLAAAEKEILAVKAMAADGGPIAVYLDKDGVVEGIDRLARRCGLRVQFAAGVARRMLFGKNPVEESADVDLAMCAPTFSIGTLLWKFKITEEIQLPARYVRRLARFKKELAALYPNLDIEIINSVDEKRLIPPYRRVSGSRVLTVDRMLAYRLKGGEWFVTDETGGSYLANARQKRLCLLPKSGEMSRIFTPLGFFSEQGPFLSYDCVLRFARLRAEFPDATVDPDSLAQIQSFVNSDTHATKEDELYFSTIEGDLAAFRKADPKMLGMERLPPLGSLFDIFMHAKDVNSVIPLLKSIGTPQRNLYTLYSSVANLEQVAEITRRGGGKTGNLADFDSAFVDEVRTHRYALVYSDDAFINFLMSALEKNTPHEYLKRARDAIIAFAKIEHANWLAKTNTMFIGERMIERYMLPRIWRQALLSRRLAKGWNWDIGLDRIVSLEFYEHVYANRARIERAVNSGRYQNLLDYYFKVFRPMSAANRQLEGIIQNAQLNDVLRPLAAGE